MRVTLDGMCDEFRFHRVRRRDDAEWCTCTMLETNIVDGGEEPIGVKKVDR